MSLNICYLTTFVVTLALAGTHANMDHFRSHDTESLINGNYWSAGMLDNSNSTLNFGSTMGCSFCGEIFYNEPPPDDIIYIPSPPLHPLIAETIQASKQQTGDQCSFCNIFNSETQSGLNQDKSFGSGYAVGVASLIAVAAVIFLYIFGVGKPRILPSFARSTLTKSHQTSTSNHHQMSKNNQLGGPLPHPPGMVDPCYLQTNREKSRTSPIISEHASHKKTAIPSKCWAQPGSIVNRTIRRIPNEYEIPSSRTNSTGASSAVYADTAYDQHQHNNNSRHYAPYNLHTYAEVREVMDQNDQQFRTSSNSSAILSESNYDNALYPQQGNMTMNSVANGTVQMSDFNSMRPAHSINYQPVQMNNHHTLNHQQQVLSNLHNQSGQPIYEQPQQRAQVIITSNNQGVNPVILNHRDRIHNVI